MIPENRLATEQWKIKYIPPDDMDWERGRDYELGGVGLNDASQGLQVKTWEAYIDLESGDGNVYITADGHPPTLIYTDPNITEISLTFDQNMAPVLAFESAGVACLRWYDSSILGYTVTELPIDCRSPKCSLDDKRDFADSYNDVIWGYIRDGNLCYRQQRDRFSIERVLASGISVDLLRIGMNEAYRLMFAIGQWND